MIGGKAISQEPGEGAVGPTPPGPEGALPRAVRPLSAVLSLGAMYSLGSGIASIMLLVLAWRELSVALFLWLGSGVLLGLPAALLMGWIGARVERLVTARRPSAVLWAPLGLGISLCAHWLPLCLWSPLLVGASVLEPHRADRYLPVAVLALGAWVAVGLGAGIVVGVGRAMQRRSWPSEKVEWTPPRVPTTALVGLVYALATAAPASFVVGFATEGDWGIAPLLVWGGAGLAAAGAMAAWQRRWVVRATAVVPSLARGADAPPVEVAGAVFAFHWLVPYVIALTPALDQHRDTRALILAAAVAAAIGGTAVWSVARARRTRASRTVPAAP